MVVRMRWLLLCPVDTLGGFVANVVSEETGNGRDVVVPGRLHGALGVPRRRRGVPARLGTGAASRRGLDTDQSRGPGPSDVISPRIDFAQNRRQHARLCDACAG